MRNRITLFVAVVLAAIAGAILDGFFPKDWGDVVLSAIRIATCGFEVAGSSKGESG